jgi:flotillin
MPLVETVDTLPLEVFSISVRCPEVLTSQGVMISAEAFGQVKASSDATLLPRAVENFLSKGSAGITSVAQEVLEGHMRAALGTMSVEEIYTERDTFAARVRQAAGEDFERLGLELLSFALKDISDSQGYLASLGARRIAEVKRDATLAQAETERDAVIQASEYRKQGDIARLQAEAELAKATRDFEMQRADFQSSVNTKRAAADVAYDLERAKLSEALKRQEYAVRLTEKELAGKVEEQEIVRREKELEATIKRPAEAMHYQAKLEAETDAYQKELEAKGKAAGIRLSGAAEAEAITAKGKAEADAMQRKAEAWKQYTDAGLAEMVIQQLPELARAVSEPLAKVDKIIMVGDASGASKLTGQVASVLAQLPAVVESLTGIKLAEILNRGKKEKANK